MSAFTAPAAAHHSSAAFYKVSESISVEGTVAEFRFISPHARVTLEVPGPGGALQTWLAEGANAAVLRRLGWTEHDLRPGDTIVVTGAPSRDGSNRIEWRSITRADGTEVGGGNGFRRERAQILERLEAQRRSRENGR